MQSEAYTQEADPIGVLVAFRDRQVTPIAFHWGKKRYRVERVNLAYRRRDGNKLYYHFAVSSQDNTFDLCFDTIRLEWCLWRANEHI